MFLFLAEMQQLHESNTEHKTKSTAVSFSVSCSPVTYSTAVHLLGHHVVVLL